MTYQQLAFTLNVVTCSPKPKPLPATSYKIIEGARTYNCSECMAPRSVTQWARGYKCTKCGQTFYQTMLPL